MKRSTLQTQLTTVVVSIVSALLIVVSALTAATLNTVLQDQLTRNVTASALRAQLWVVSAVRAAAPDAAAVLLWDAAAGGSNKFLQPGTLLILDLPTGLSGAYLDPENEVTVLTASELSGVTGPTFTVGKARDILVAGAGTYRVAAQPLDDGVMLIGLPRAQVDSTVGLMLVTISLVTLGALILLGLAIGVTIRTSLRPLRAMAATARRVAQLPLERGRVTINDRVADTDLDDHTEVGHVGRALNTMIDHVDSSLNARAANEERMRQFIADASHELRTPLTSIRGYSELSLRDPTNSPDTTSSLERIHAQSLRMTRLVEDLLLLARLDEGQEIVLRPVDLVPLTIEALADAQAAGDGHHSEWESDLDELWVAGDAGRLHQVITNLLANAHAHTPVGTRVTLTADRDGTDAVVRIHDNGPGIEPTVRDTLFERFARADLSRTRNTGGSGLGLSIAAAIVVAHGGSLDVVSEPGSTTFTVRLPSVTPALTSGSSPLSS